MEKETVQKSLLFPISVPEFKVNIQMGSHVCNFFTPEVKDYL